MLKAIIVEDEISGELLRLLLIENWKDINVVTISSAASQILQAVSEFQPQLLFLNIELPLIRAFQLIDEIRPYSIDIILMSEHDKYAVEAIRSGAIDFLIKPVKIEDLRIALEKVKHRLHIKMQQEVFPLLKELQVRQKLIDNIALPTLEGLQMVALHNIIYCSSHSNYTYFNLRDKQKLHICRTLKQVESMLEKYHFCRVHHSFIVNLNEIKKYIKGEGGSVVMSDDTTISVSRPYKEVLLQRLHNYK